MSVLQCCGCMHHGIGSRARIHHASSASTVREPMLWNAAPRQIKLILKMLPKVTSNTDDTDDSDEDSVTQPVVDQATDDEAADDRAIIKLERIFDILDKPSKYVMCMACCLVWQARVWRIQSTNVSVGIVNGVGSTSCGSMVCTLEYSSRNTKIRSMSGLMS